MRIQHTMGMQYPCFRRAMNSSPGRRLDGGGYPPADASGTAQTTRAGSAEGHSMDTATCATATVLFLLDAFVAVAFLGAGVVSTRPMVVHA